MLSLLWRVIQATVAAAKRQTDIVATHLRPSHLSATNIESKTTVVSDNLMQYTLFYQEGNFLKNRELLYNDS